MLESLSIPTLCLAQIALMALPRLGATVPMADPCALKDRDVRLALESLRGLFRVAKRSLKPETIVDFDDPKAFAALMCAIERCFGPSHNGDGRARFDRLALAAETSVSPVASDFEKCRAAEELLPLLTAVGKDLKTSRG